MDLEKVRTELESDAAEVSKVSREVVAKRVAIIAVVTVLLNLMVGYGIFGIDTSNEVLKYVGAIFDAGTALAAIVAVRPGVTPLHDPKDSNGETLVPVSSAVALVEKNVNEVTEAVSAKNIATAPQVLQDVADSAKQLVQDVKTDVAAVASPIEEAHRPSPVKAVQATTPSA